MTTMPGQRRKHRLSSGLAPVLDSADTFITSPGPGWTWTTKSDPSQFRNWLGGRHPPVGERVFGPVVRMSQAQTKDLLLENGTITNKNGQGADASDDVLREIEGMERVVGKRMYRALLHALNEPNLDARVAEGLPWLALTYVDMDREWLVRNAKVNDVQNRLGFAVSLTREVAEGKNDSNRAEKLGGCLEILERARLAGEDTFCHDSMTQAERAWLRQHRSRTARHWNLLTDMEGKHLA